MIEGRPRARLRNPENSFNSPMAVVNAPDMARTEKIEALDDWAVDVERRLASTGEGMPAQGQSDPDLRLLDEIHEAKRFLLDARRPAIT
jgi:hypothetical protein